MKNQFNIAVQTQTQQFCLVCKKPVDKDHSCVYIKQVTTVLNLNKK